MRHREAGRRQAMMRLREMGLYAFLITAVALIVGASTSSEARCKQPVEVTTQASVSYRYVWFFIESLTHPRVAWQEVDLGADSHNAVVRLANFKLAVEDFQCAASLVQPFQGSRVADALTTEAIQVSAGAATLAYTTFANSFQRWATAFSRGEGLSVEEAADLKIQNETGLPSLAPSARRCVTDSDTVLKCSFAT